jgi:catechol 2,3-dioxygenase-like lactoylglutathione lyase family enzyme
MEGFGRQLARAGAAFALWALAAAAPIGQVPATSQSVTPRVIDTGAYTPFVENMDRSLAFYHDVFGMEVPPLPESGGPRPFNNSNPRLFAMFDIMGAKERHQSARVHGIRTGVEPMEIRDVTFKKIPLRIQDPGNATLVLMVRDLDTTLARVKQGGYPVVSAGGVPVTFADGTRAAVIRDVDDRFIEIRQPAKVPASAPAGNIVDIRAMIAVADLDQTLRIYRDVLGFTIEGETPFAADKAVRALTGLAQAEVRSARAKAQNSALWFEFVEFKGVERTPLNMRIQDRGATRVQFRTQGIDALVEAVKKAGLHVVSHGGVAVPIPPDFRGALVADPNNFFFSLFEPCDGCAPRVLPAAQTAAAQAPAAAAPPATRPPLLFKETWREPPFTGERTDENQRFVPSVVTNPKIEARLYGPDSKVIRAARHEGRFDLWTGMATSPVGLTLRDKQNYVDLTGLARLKWIVRTNAIHTLYPMVKLADGTLAAGNKGIVTDGEFIEVEIAFGGMKWFKLDPVKLVVLDEVQRPNLARVDEVGLVSLAPAGGHGTAGSANLSDVELYAKAVPR